MTPTEIDQKLKSYISKMLEGTITDKEKSEYEYLLLYKRNSICNLPTLIEFKRKYRK